LLAALVTGSLAGLAVLTLATLRGWPSGYALIAAAGAALVSWLFGSARFAALVEYAIAPDKPKPAPFRDTGPQTVNLHIHKTEDDGNVIEGEFLDYLPVSGEGLARLAELVVSGASLTTSAITAGGLPRATWENLRDRLVSAGLLAWRGGARAHGCVVTGRGLVVFRRLAGSPGYTPPTPHRAERIDFSKY
jgi:hypothetical protein